MRSTATHKAKAVNPVSEVVQTQLTARRIRFDPRSVHSAFVVDEVSLTLRSLTLYIYGAPILVVSRSHTTTQHSR